MKMTHPKDMKKYSCIIPSPVDEQQKDDVDEANKIAAQKLLQPLAATCLYRVSLIILSHSFYSFKYCLETSSDIINLLDDMYWISL